MGMNQRRRVTINAALSMIYAEGYDAQAVIGWAKEYQRKGYDQRRSYEQALNEFIAGQPDLGPAIVKFGRLIQASDEQTVAQYDHALSTYIQTGDNSAMEALAPMIARDSVALAVKNGELQGGVTPENVQAALGFEMEGAHIQAATQATAPAQQAQPEPAAAAPPTFSGGYVSAKDQAKWAAAPNVGAGEARGLLAGRTQGDGVNPSQTI